jgi:hypothetical protein
MISRMDVRAQFEERAAILEFDHGVPRAEAEAQAVREAVDQRTDAPGMLGELAQAERTQSDPRLATILAAMRLKHPRACAWGFLHIVIEGDSPLWRPAISPEIGKTACVVAATQDGGLVDLAAATLDNHRIALTRHGTADLLGADEVEQARETGSPLFVFESILNWLQAGTRGCVVIDWRRAAILLDGVRVILCNKRLADRLLRATASCWPRPDVRILKALPHAA